MIEDESVAAKWSELTAEVSGHMPNPAIGLHDVFARLVDKCACHCNLSTSPISTDDLT